jgi:hypothetical protein
MAQAQQNADEGKRWQQQHFATPPLQQQQQHNSGGAGPFASQSIEQ